MCDSLTQAPERIESASDLERLCRRLEPVDLLACDLEADSMYHFREKVCLIQLATRDMSAVIDPLAVTDLSPLKAVFSRRDVCKVFHGADYDVRSLYRDFGIEIVNLFDTQVASMFLGVRETGLEAVVKARFDVHLDKRFQKKDWSRRPLPAEMVEYAVMDAVWLVPLVGMLTSELDALGRVEWVREECELLSRVRPAAPNEGPLFLKFRGAGQMQGRELAVLEALLVLRRRISEKKDRPMFKVFSNSALKKIALHRPRNSRELAAIRALSDKQLSMYAKPLMEAVSGALDLPTDRLPRYPRRRFRSAGPEAPERVRALKTWRDRRAQELDIDPALVGNKTLLNAIASKNPLRLEGLDSIEEMRAWQRQAFGPEIIATLKRVVPVHKIRRRRRSRRN